MSDLYIAFLLGLGVSVPLVAWLPLALRRIPIRGIGSFYDVAYGINHGDFGSKGRLWAIVDLVVVTAVIIHGLTVTALMRWLDRKGEPNVRPTSQTPPANSCVSQPAQGPLEVTQNLSTTSVAWIEQAFALGKQLLLCKLGIALCSQPRKADQEQTDDGRCD